MFISFDNDDDDDDELAVGSLPRGEIEFFFFSSFSGHDRSRSRNILTDADFFVVRGRHHPWRRCRPSQKEPETDWRCRWSEPVPDPRPFGFQFFRICSRRRGFLVVAEVFLGEGALLRLGLRHPC